MLGTINVLQAAVRSGARRVVFASSGGAIYGGGAKLPATERTAKYPESPYGITKKIVEDYFRWFKASYGLDYVLLAMANIFGPRQDPGLEGGVTAIFAQAMLEGRRPTIFGDGSQTRDYVYVGDTVDAYLAGRRRRPRGAAQHRQRPGDLGAGVVRDAGPHHRVPPAARVRRPQAGGHRPLGGRPGAGQEGAGLGGLDPAGGGPAPHGGVVPGAGQGLRLAGLSPGPAIMGAMPYTLIPDLASRAEVPEAGTLSRVLHNDERVRLVLFAFDAGQELTEHTASVPALLQVVSGRFRVGAGGDTFEMGPEAWLRLDAGEPHSLLALEPSRLLLTMLPG